MRFSRSFRLFSCIALLTFTGCQQDETLPGTGGAAGVSGLNGPLAGTVWEGVAGKWGVTLNIEQHVDSMGSEMLMGTISSTVTECFKEGRLVVQITGNSLEFLSSSHGTLADSSSVKFKGEMEENSMKGRLTVTAYTDEEKKPDSEVDPQDSLEKLCEVTNLPFEFTRK